MANNLLLFETFQSEQEWPSPEERKDIAESQIEIIVEEIHENRDDLDIEAIRAMTPYQKIDTWLQWEGICGYTDDIIRLVAMTLGLGLTEDEFDKVLYEGR